MVMTRATDFVIRNNVFSTSMGHDYSYYSGKKRVPWCELRNAKIFRKRADAESTATYLSCRGDGFLIGRISVMTYEEAEDKDWHEKYGPNTRDVW